MISIYCLADPFTGVPFYVGATEFSLKERLSQHITFAGRYKYAMDWGINELKHFPIQRRTNYINLLINSNKKPLINLLLECDTHSADYYEKYFFELFQKQGFYMHQDKKRFHSQQRKKQRQLNNSNRMKPVLFDKYQQHLFGNLSRY